MSSTIPFIPNSAPFTPEQRAWLNGYFVGLLSAAHGAENVAAAAPTKAEPLLIGFGSQTGTAEQLALQTAATLRDSGCAVEVKSLGAL